MHPEPKLAQVEPVSKGGRGNLAFAANTMAATGEAKSSINRHVARATAVEEAGSSIADLAGICTRRTVT